MAADVRLAPDLGAGRPRELFLSRGRLHAYDVAADGQRFLMVLKPRSSPEPRHLNVVTNWQRRCLN